MFGTFYKARNIFCAGGVQKGKKERKVWAILLDKGERMIISESLFQNRNKLQAPTDVQTKNTVTNRENIHGKIPFH